ncbi:vacuolar iron transporter homolog 4-like [Gastrolobium bilobum]|uniref:vacuolar iron transporter homolog 4-like n=1 Tax=Gastrolobium bilobum TaxID=150636 RepID=UPI002AB128E2|nr:vacuolar iron transporter homolog 4-like [Gastrolobium bilobum]
MDAFGQCGLVSLNHVEVVPNHANGQDQKQTKVTEHSSNIDFSQRAQWLRAAVLGANDGLVSVASLMMAIGAVRTDVKSMLLTGFAGLVAGACSMGIGEFVSVYTQYEVEVGQMKRDMSMNGGGEAEKDVEILGMEKRTLPNPWQAAFASAFAFSIGAMVPLLAAGSIRDHNIRLMVVVAVASLALVIFGGVGAVLGKTPKIRSCVRVLLGGWLAMAITFGLTKLLGSSALEL